MVNIENRINACFKESVSNVAASIKVINKIWSLYDIAQPKQFQQVTPNQPRKIIMQLKSRSSNAGYDISCKLIKATCDSTRYLILHIINSSASKGNTTMPKNKYNHSSAKN